MEHYLDKKRFIHFYRIQALGKADLLRTTARQAAIRHIKDGELRAAFNHEVHRFTQEQLHLINRASHERECRYFLNNLHQEKKFIEDQDRAVTSRAAKVAVAIELKNNLDAWGYFINSVGIIIGGVQIIAGAGIVFSSVFSGHVTGMMAGTAIVLHGVNNAYESFENLRNDRNNTEGHLRGGYVKVAEFLGFNASAGRIAYSMADLTLSGYGLARMILKPDAWRLFRYLPSDFVRSIKTIGAPSLALEVPGDSITLKNIYDQR